MLAPKGNYNPENSPLVRFSYMGASLLAISHFKPDVKRIAEDDFFGFFRRHIMLGYVVDVCTVPIKK